MNNKTTAILASVVVVIFAVIGVGYITSQPAPQPEKQPATQTEAPLPTAEELITKLQAEQPAIDTALVAALPQVSTLYTVERGKLYVRGEWYGAILQYKGTDTSNRDTLRIVMQKKGRTMDTSHFVSAATC